MNREGSYYCSAVKLPLTRPETLAEEDVSRIRCYQDEWTIHERGPHLHRILFQDQHCSTPLGKIEADLNPPHCAFVKDDPDWLGEDKGKCLLHQIPLHQPTSIQVLQSCSKAVPSFCFHPKSAMNIIHSSPESITIRNGDQTQICTRNPK